MENQNVVNGLLRRRQLIADELEVVQGRLRQLVIEIDAIDLTIRLFQPDAQIGLVRVKPVPRRHAALRGESTRMILGALRDAGKPLTSREIVTQIMEARGMNTGDPDVVRTMRMRLATSLRKLAHRGKVSSDGALGGARRWGVISSTFAEPMVTSS